MTFKWSIVLVSDRQSLLSPDGKTSCFQNQTPDNTEMQHVNRFCCIQDFIGCWLLFSNYKRNPHWTGKRWIERVIRQPRPRSKSPAICPKKKSWTLQVVLVKACPPCKNWAWRTWKDLPFGSKMLVILSLNSLKSVEFQSCSLWQSQPGQGRSHQDFTAKSAAVY